MLHLSFLNNVESNLEDFKNKIAQECFDLAVQDVAEKIGELSQKKVPVQEGILKSTFTFQKVQGVWYIGYNTRYAKYQHQGRDEQGNRIIKNRPGGGQTGFLTKTIEQNKDQLLRFLTQRFYHYLSKKI